MTTVAKESTELLIAELEAELRAALPADVDKAVFEYRLDPAFGRHVEIYLGEEETFVEVASLQRKKDNAGMAIVAKGLIERLRRRDPAYRTQFTMRDVKREVYLQTKAIVQAMYGPDVASEMDAAAHADVLAVLGRPIGPAAKAGELRYLARRLTERLVERVTAIRKKYEESRKGASNG